MATSKHTRGYGIHQSWTTRDSLHAVLSKRTTLTLVEVVGALLWRG